MKKTTINNNLITVQFRYDPNLVYAVKSITGRKYDPTNKAWTFPVSPQGIEFLKNNDFPLPEELNKKKFTKRLRPIEVPGLKKELWRYQKIGVAFIDSDIYCKQGRAIIGDDMQVGKSPQAISWLQLRKDISLPTVILCPANVKYKWEREIKQWTNLFPYVIEGKNPEEELPEADIYIINYNILFSPAINFLFPMPFETTVIGGQVTYGTNSETVLNFLLGYLFIIREMSWLQFLINKDIQTIIGDEIHYVKSEKSIRTKAFKALAKGAPHFIPMSGTFVDNRPKDIFVALNIIDRLHWPSFWKFAHRYCDPKHNGFGWDFNGASNLEELHKKLSQIMLRRTRKEVGLEIPTQTEIIPVKIDNYNEYQYAENDFIDWVLQEKGEANAIKINKAQQLAKIEYLKQITQKGKMKTVLSWVENFFEANPNEKLIVFAHHKDAIDKIMNKFKKIAIKIVGGTPPKKRVSMYDKFNTDKKIRLFVGSLAASEGIPLKSASNICFLELWWKPGQHDQAGSRAQGIGQKANSINNWYFIAKNTIEEDLIDLLDEKRKDIDMIQDGKETEKESLLTELINKMIKRKN
jgi:SWI/SNF-related matrix-associated actin-dependent regulator 1 of chromatin subfamily A